MAKVLVTGMSGTGKSSVLRVLAGRGHRVVDTDTDEWNEWALDADGRPDWIWREDAITELLARHEHGHLFVAGCRTNQGRFYDRFDAVVLLSAPAEVLLARIDGRSDNPYGKSDEERALVLRHLTEVEPLLRRSATLELDATAPPSELADRLERAAASSVATRAAAPAARSAP